MVVANQLYESTKFFKIVLEVVLGEMIFNHLNEVCVPVPESKIFQKCGKLQHNRLGNEVEAFFNIVLNIGTKTVFCFEVTFVFEHL